MGSAVIVTQSTTRWCDAVTSPKWIISVEQNVPKCLILVLSWLLDSDYFLVLDTQDSFLKGAICKNRPPTEFLLPTLNKLEEVFHQKVGMSTTS